MKRLSLLVVIFLLGLACCSTRKTEEKDGSAINFTRNYGHLLSSATEIERTVYFLDHPISFSHYIRYAEAESNTAGPLCGKAECTHSDSSCNSWVDESGMLFAYENRIYWIRTDASGKGRFLMCMDRSGDNHRQIRRLTDDLNDVNFPTGNTYMQIHKNSAYVVGFKQTISNGDYLLHCVIKGYDLYSEKEYTVFSSELSELPGYITMQCVGDYVYYAFSRILAVNPDETVKEDSERPKYLNDRDSAMILICRYNIKNQETEVMYQTDVVNSTIKTIMPEEDYIYFLREQSLDPTDKESALYRLNNKTRQIEECFDIEFNGTPGSFYLLDGMVFIYQRPQEGVMRALLTDFCGNVLLDEKYKWDKLEQCSMLYLGGDDHYIYLSYDQFLGSKSISYFVSISIKEKSMTILWQEEHEYSG